MERGGEGKGKGEGEETTCLTSPHWLLPQIPPWLQLRFNFDPTAVRLLIKGHQGHSDVTR